MTAYYPTRGSAERIVGSSQAAPGHIHPGYVQHFLGDEQPATPRGGDMWTRGGSVEFSYTHLTMGATALADFYVYEQPGGIITMRFVLPDGAEEVQALHLTISYAVADASYGSGVPGLDLILNGGSTLSVPLDGTDDDLVMTTVTVPAPADWLALAENESFLDVDYTGPTDQIALYDLSLTLLRTGFVYSYDGAQWVLMSTGGEVIESHNELIGREAINAHPIAAVTGLQPALDGKAPAVHLHDHGTLSGLGDDDHPQYLDNVRGYPRDLADQTFVNVIGDTMTGGLTVNADVATGPLRVRSVSVANPRITLANQAGVEQARIEGVADEVRLLGADGTETLRADKGRTTVFGMLNVMPPGVSNELSITAGFGAPGSQTYVDGYGLYVDISGATGPLWHTEIPGDTSTWLTVGGSSTHAHDELYSLLGHGHDANYLDKGHAPLANGGTLAGSLLHVQYPTIDPADLGLSAGKGVSDTIARADHVHKRPTLAELNAAAAAHTHAAADIASGTVAFARLPTGTTASTVAIGNHTHAYAPDTRTLTAGAGLTGGGTLAADRTFNVGAGTGITVNADDVAINRAQTDSWYDAAGTGASAASSSMSGHTGASDPHSQYQLVSARGVASGYAPLGADNLVPNVHLPATRTANYFSVATDTARKTLSTYSPTGLYRGDNVIVTSPANTWVYVGTTSPADSTSVASDANWTQLASGGVQSVNTKTGVVVLAASDVGAPATSLTLTAGAGLTGGGTLAANRTFDVGAGTGITVAADSVAVNRAVVDGWYASPASVTSAIGTHAASSDHDSRYYTEAEVNSLLSGKSDGSHLHDAQYVNADGDTMTGELRVDAFSSAAIVRTSDPPSFATKPGALWIREDDDTGAADPTFDPSKYSSTSHLHAGVYSPVGHSHTGDFATAAHNHDGLFAPAGHSHAGYLATSGGTVTGDLNVGGLVATAGMVRTTEPGTYRPGQLWVREDQNELTRSASLAAVVGDLMSVRPLQGIAVAPSYLWQGQVPYYLDTPAAVRVPNTGVTGLNWTWTAPWDCYVTAFYSYAVVLVHTSAGSAGYVTIGLEYESSPGVWSSLAEFPLYRREATSSFSWGANSTVNTMATTTEPDVTTAPVFVVSAGWKIRPAFSLRHFIGPLGSRQAYLQSCLVWLEARRGSLTIGTVAST